MKYLGLPQSGSVANLTYSRNTFGPYVKVRTGRGGVPALSLAGADLAWQALGQAQQLSWDVWSEQLMKLGSLGAQRPISGFQRFVSAWCFATLFGGGTLPTAAPTERITTSILVATFGFTSLYHAESFVVVDASGGCWVEWQMNYPYSSSGTNSPPGRRAYWKFVSAVHLVGGGTAIATFDYTALAPPSGTRAFWRARVVGDDFVAAPWRRLEMGVF